MSLCSCASQLPNGSEIRFQHLNFTTLFSKCFIFTLLAGGTSTLRAPNTTSFQVHPVSIHSTKLLAGGIWPHELWHHHLPAMPCNALRPSPCPLEPGRLLSWLGLAVLVSAWHHLLIPMSCVMYWAPMNSWHPPPHTHIHTQSPKRTL